ncbi:MAG: ABC transporter ATP-binding protein [Ignavibacteria bacterium]|nr:ABC transporter ATP-binding protein [Ignavibacteria bacterium]MDH7527762.1 ABC transporter ATP-binding protein [Ignavibacteria bacterium]
MKAIIAEELIKVYSNSKSSVRALDEVSFDITQGQICALLGPNGAGKTTLVKILLGFIKPTSGLITIFGSSPEEAKFKTSIGYLPETFVVSSNFTVLSFLKYLGELSGLSSKLLANRIEELLNLFSLTEVKEKKINTLSKGMLQKLLFAQSIIHNPDLLVLDEPTEGLDPEGRRIIRKILLDLKEEGKTIIINSHLLSEIELLADSIIILKKGKLIVKGGLSELLPPDQTFEIYFSYLPEINDGFEFVKTSDGWKMRISGAENLQKVLSFFENRNIKIEAIKSSSSNLEDVFFSYINEG